MYKYLILISVVLFTQRSFSNDEVTMFGKLKAVDGATIKIQLRDGQVLVGPQKSVHNFDDKDSENQFFEIDKIDLKLFNLQK